MHGTTRLISPWQIHSHATQKRMEGGWHLGARAGGLLERGVILQPRPIRFPQFPLPGGAGSHVARRATAPGGSGAALSVRAGCRRPVPQDVAPGRGRECAFGPWMDQRDPWAAARGFQCFCVLNARIHGDACVPGFSVADEGRNAAEPSGRSQSPDVGCARPLWVGGPARTDATIRDRFPEPFFSMVP